MRPPGSVLSRGFSMLELAIAITLISILFVFITTRLLEIIDQAEQVEVQKVIGDLQSALAIELVEHVVKGHMDKINRLPGSNPMELLSNPPKNYRGAITGKLLQQAEDGNWYFNTDKHLLTYFVHDAEHFHSELPGRPRLRLKIVPVYDDRDGNHVFDHKIDQIKGVVLSFQDSFTWTGLKTYIKSYKN